MWKLARVGCLVRVFGTKTREHVEDVVCGQMRCFAHELNRQAKLEEAQALWGRNPAQLLRALTIKRRFRVNKNPEQARLVLLIKSIKRKLHAVGQEFPKLRFNRVCNAAKTAHKLAFACHFVRKTCGATCAHDGLRLRLIKLVARVLYK